MLQRVTTTSEITKLKFRDEIWFQGNFNEKVFKSAQLSNYILTNTFLIFFLFALLILYFRRISPCSMLRNGFKQWLKETAC